MRNRNSKPTLSSSPSFLISCLLLAFTLLMPTMTTAQATAPFERTIVISPIPGDVEGSGDRLKSAVAAVQPTADSPWLIKVEPGIYDIGASFLEMKPWLDLEGSGIGQTVIQGYGQDPQFFNRGKGTLVGADHSEIRDLQVRCVTHEPASLTACIALANSFASPRISNVRLVADGVGTHWGIRNTASSPRLDDIEILVADGTENYGIVNVLESRPSIRRTLIQSRDGSVNNFGVFNRDGGLPTVIQEAEIQVSGGQRAVGIFDYTPGQRQELRLTGGAILVEGAAENYGVLNGNMYLLVRGTRIAAEGKGTAIDLNAQGRTEIFNSELTGNAIAIRTAELRLGSTLLRGSGVVSTTISATCGGVVVINDSLSDFYADQCPTFNNKAGFSISNGPIERTDGISEWTL